MSSWCYECQRNHINAKMQKYSCVICGGTKCIRHGGQFLECCKRCKTNYICIDCLSFGKCCEEVQKRHHGMDYKNYKPISRPFISKY